MMTDKFCKDCAHQMERPVMDVSSRTWFPPARIPWLVPGCARFNKRISPVSGALVVYEPCRAERERTWLDRLFGRDKCGPEGKYWEANIQADADAQAEESARFNIGEKREVKGEWAEYKDFGTLKVEPDRFLEDILDKQFPNPGPSRQDRIITVPRRNAHLTGERKSND